MSAQPPTLAPSLPARTEPAALPLRSVCTENFPALLRELGASIMVTTGQAGKLVILRADNGAINTHFRDFNSPTGLALAGDRLAVGTALAIWEFHNAPAVADTLEPPGKHDACFLPRGSHCTGNIQIAEMAWGAGDELWSVSTRFSCLCTRDTRFSFVPRWRPSFITAIAPEDRCHLSGLALADGQPRWVTALAVSDERDGWRPHQKGGGVVVDVPSGEIVGRGLSLPHAPRYHDGRLWLLNSGDGTLGTLDPHTGRYEEVAALPGFPRGLAFHGRFAFVGVSQVRASAIFSGLAIAERPMEERCCGVWVLDVVTGQTVAFVRFEEGVEEIFAVQVVAGRRFPDVLNDDRSRLADSFVLPDEPLNHVPEPYVQVTATPLSGEAWATSNAIHHDAVDSVAAASSGVLCTPISQLPDPCFSDPRVAGRRFVVRESGPHDLAHLRSWLPGAGRGTPPAQTFVAVDAATGAVAGVASLRVYADRGGRFDLFVPPAFKRRGVGTALLDGVRQTAVRAGVTRLLSSRAFETSADDEVSKAARAFALARGLVVVQEIGRCRAELKAALAVLEPLQRRFEERRPAGALRVRYVMVDEVDPRQVAAYVVRHGGGVYEEALERLREPPRGLMRTAMIALAGDAIVGGTVADMRRGEATVETLFVEDSHRGAGVDLGLMYHMSAAASFLGFRMIEFEYDLTNANRAKLARRFGATHVGYRQCFGCALSPASVEAKARRVPVCTSG